MTQSKKILEMFGGISALSKVLGHKNSSTVQGWKERGIIPVRQMQPVLDKGIELGLDISVHDFFEERE